MRVLHLVNDSSYGSATSVAQTARALATSGVEIEVASFSRVTTPAQPRLARDLASSKALWRTLSLPEHPRWARPRLLVRVFDVPSVLRAIGAERFDVLHAHDLFSGFYAAIAARHAGVPVVATHHGEVGHPVYIRLYEYLYRLWCRRFFRIGVPSSALVRNLAPWVGHERLVQIVNGLDVPSWERRLSTARDLRAELGLPPDRFVLGVSARLSPEKGHRVALEAFSRLPSAVRCRTSMVIAGAGSDRDRLMAQAARLGLSDRVHFLGYLQEMPRFWRTIDLLVHPSFNENTPMNILEAMASRVAVVASAVGEIPTMLGEGAGILVPPGDPQSLAEAMTRLAGDPERRRELAGRARRRVEDLYDSEAVARRTVRTLYQPALEAADPAPWAPTGGRRGPVPASAVKAVVSRSLGRLCSRMGPRPGPVLCYHDVGSDRRPHPYDPRLAVAVDRLEEHVEVLARHFELVSVAELASDVGRARRRRRPLAALTFDDGYASAAELVAPLLERRGVPATFFVNSSVVGGGLLWPDRLASLARALPHEILARALTDAGEGVLVERLLTVLQDDVDSTERARRWVGVARTSPAGEVLALVAGLDGLLATLPAVEFRPRHLTREQLRGLSGAGFEIGGHTLEHPVLTRLPAEELRRQIEEDRRRIAAWTGRAPASFAYPFGLWDGEARTAVEAAGYSWGFAVETGVRDRVGSPTAWPRVLASDLIGEVSPGRFSPGLFLAQISRLAAGAARRRRR